MVEPTFSLEEAIRAQRRLREALGLGEERFPVPAFVEMIGDEIEAMRGAGRSDQEIADIVAEATGRRIEPGEIGRHHAAPGEGRTSRDGR